MEGMQKNTIDEPYLKRLSAHLRTINEHRYQVMKNCFACGLYRQGLTHDLSKYSFSEFHESVKYFQGTLTKRNTLVLQLDGCIIKAETNTIGNTGMMS